MIAQLFNDAASIDNVKVLAYIYLSGNEHEVEGIFHARMYPIVDRHEPSCSLDKVHVLSDSTSVDS